MAAVAALDHFASRTFDKKRNQRWKRETKTDADAALTMSGDGMLAFTEWTLLLTAERVEGTGLWVKADGFKTAGHLQDTLTNGAGVYELAVILEVEGAANHTAVVYVGKAAESKSPNGLRKRIFTYMQKSVGGGGVSSAVPEYLQKGFQLHARWALADGATPSERNRQAEKAESRLLDAYDYAFAKEHNPDVRAAMLVRDGMLVKIIDFVDAVAVDLDVELEVEVPPPAALSPDEVDTVEVLTDQMGLMDISPGVAVALRKYLEDYQSVSA